MSMLYDYKCVNNCDTVFEKFAGAEDKWQICPNCGVLAERVIPAPMVKLEGWSGSFPSAALRWDKLHMKYGKIETGRKP